MNAAILERASRLYHRTMIRHGEKLGLSNRMALAKSINRMKYRRFIDYRESLLSDADYLAYTQGAEALNLDDGWCAPGASLNFTGHPVLADAAAILAEDRGATSKKGFMINHLTENDLKRFPSFVEAALHPTVLKTAAAYLGMYPVMSSVKLLVSSPMISDHLLDSQMFHLDHADNPLLKLIINVAEVTDESGPFCFLPASTSGVAKARLGYGRRGVDYRVDDAAMYGVVDSDDLVVLTGAEGDTAFVDTSRCFHYGSRNSSKERRIIMYSFSTPARSDFRKPTDYSAILPSRDKLRKALLNPYFAG